MHALLTISSVLLQILKPCAGATEGREWVDVRSYTVAASLCWSNGLKYSTGSRSFKVTVIIAQLVALLQHYTYLRLGYL